MTPGNKPAKSSSNIVYASLYSSVVHPTTEEARRSNLLHHSNAVQPYFTEPHQCCLCQCFMPQDEAYAVGSNGTILHYSTGVWAKLPRVAGLDSSLALYAVWVDRSTAGQVIYAAGDNSVMVSCDRQRVCRLLSEHCLSITHSAVQSTRVYACRLQAVQWASCMLCAQR
jgi:hypothetical protein